MQDYMKRKTVGFNYIQATSISNALQHFINTKKSHIDKAEMEPQQHTIEGLFDFVNACNIHSQLQQQFKRLKRSINISEFQRRIRNIPVMLNEAEFTLLKDLLTQEKERSNGTNKFANFQFTTAAA